MEIDRKGARLPENGKARAIKLIPICRKDTGQPIGTQSFSTRQIVWEEASYGNMKFKMPEWLYQKNVLHGNIIK